MADRRVALITGASSGIGAELAREFARNGFDLVLSARRTDRLRALADQIGGAVEVDVVGVDLSKSRGPARLQEHLGDLGRTVDVLVNNAGVALSGPFQDYRKADVRDLLDLNIRALTELTMAVLPGMVARRSGRILNVASVAAFQPVPGLSVYAATKAYVLSLTESLAEDLRDTGVTVTALCPGPTRTEMMDEIPGLELAGPLLADARSVAREGYQACMAGEVIRIPGLVNQASVTWSRYQPRWLVRMISGMAARSLLGNGNRSGP
ncbi:MAG: SDR family oxidoreductase [Pseudomonadales bacterium]